MSEYQHTYPSADESVDKMMDDVIKLLKQHKISPKLVHEVTLCLSEAFTNAFVHGNRRDPNKIITVRLQLNENEIKADVIDQGKGALKKLKARKPSTLLAEGGRGLEFIEHFADSADYRETEDGGLKVTIVFRSVTKESVG